MLGVLAKPAKKTTVAASVHFDGAPLKQDSYNTAQVSGALALMDYKETKSYADIYSLQNEFMAAQRASYQNHASALIGSFVADPHLLEDLTQTEKETLRDRLRVYSGDLFLLKSLARQLDKAYQEHR